MTRIGITNDSALTCHTDSTTCCRGRDNPQGGFESGEWLFPNGTMITANSVTGSGFHWIRYFQAVGLYRHGDIQVLGRYCCRIPNRHGDVVSVCANLTGEFTVFTIKSNTFIGGGGIIIMILSCRCCSGTEVYPDKLSYCFYVTANTIRCPSDSVMAPTNGMVSYSSPPENNSYIYGTVATFSCSTGFSLDGISTRTCGTEQGTFSGTTPSCIGERIPSCVAVL